MKYFLNFTAIACLVGVCSLPIFYYTFLRIVVGIAFIWLAFNAFKQKTFGLGVVFSIIFILFNPVFPVYLRNKILWIPLDIGVAILLLWVANRKSEEDRKVLNVLEKEKKEKNYSRDKAIIPKKI